MFSPFTNYILCHSVCETCGTELWICLSQEIMQQFKLCDVYVAKWNQIYLLIMYLLTYNNTNFFMPSSDILTSFMPLNNCKKMYLSPVVY